MTENITDNPERPKDYTGLLTDAAKLALERTRESGAKPPYSVFIIPPTNRLQQLFVGKPPPQATDVWILYQDTPQAELVITFCLNAKGDFAVEEMLVGDPEIAYAVLRSANELATEFYAHTLDRVLEGINSIK